MRASALAAVIALVTIALSASAAPALADDDTAVTWSVAPASADGPDGRSWVEKTLEPGESATEYFAVRNLGATATTFRLSAADGYFTKTGRFNMLQSGQESVDAGTWISLNETVQVEPGATAVVPFTISVPENATPGDHPAGIAASVMSSGTTTDGAQIGVESRVGFRVIAQVTGELAPALAVTDVTSEYSPSWNLFSPGALTISYTATNTGNTQLSFGETVGSAFAPRGDLFPGETRTVVVESVDAWPLGLVSVDLVIDSSVPSDETLPVIPVVESVTFVAVPWLHLAAVAGVAVVIALLILARRRNAAKIDRMLDEARAEGRKQRDSVVSP